MCSTQRPSDKIDPLREKAWQTKGECLIVDSKSKLHDKHINTQLIKHNVQLIYFKKDHCKTLQGSELQFIRNNDVINITKGNCEQRIAL